MRGCINHFNDIAEKYFHSGLKVNKKKIKSYGESFKPYILYA